MAGSGEWSLRLACLYVRCGGLIAYPTEGVVGLGCDPLNQVAVQRLLDLKRRDWHRGLIIIGSDLAQLLPFVGTRDVVVINRLRASWPGAITWLVPAAPGTPRWLTGGRSTIALRVPAHGQARALCRACGPLISTSANRSGRPPARTILGSRARFGAAISYYVPGVIGDHAGPSKIQDVRSGAISRA